MAEVFDSVSRPFYRSTEKMGLEPIPLDEYYDFASGKMASDAKVLSKEIFPQIYESLGGHTWYVQYLLNVLYEHCNGVISAADVALCLQRIITAEQEGFHQRCAMLTSNQYALLCAIAADGVVPEINAADFVIRHSLRGSSSINAALKKLIDYEMVFRSRQSYSVCDRFMALWLRSLPWVVAGK